MRNTPNHAGVFKKFIIALCLFSTSYFCATAQDLVMANADPNQAQQNAKGNKLKTVPLRIFMQQFQEATHIYYSYSSDAVKEKMVQYEAIPKRSKENLGQQLNKVLKPAGLTYKKVDNVYIIIPEEKTNATPVSYEVHTAAAIDIAVSGTVKDINGTSLGGITVQEKTTTNMTTTNDNGYYTLRVSGPEAILVFSSVGYLQYEVPVGNQTTVNVTLEPGKAEQLSNIDVTALVITRNKRSLAYSVS